MKGQQAWVVQWLWRRDGEKKQNLIFVVRPGSLRLPLLPLEPPVGEGSTDLLTHKALFFLLYEHPLQLDIWPHD